jgi:polyhydroxybutyrate depolymerase
VVLPAATLTADRAAASVHETLTWGGIRRSYHIYVPQGYSRNTAVPIVLVLHGGGGTGEGMVKLTGGRFNELAERDGFIVVYPDGVEKHWNDGRRIQSWRAHKEKIDDVGFISAVMDEVGVRGSEFGVRDSQHPTLDMEPGTLNPSRGTRHQSARPVFVTGISNGGLMSYRLACELSDKVSGIAAVTASLSEDLYRVCTPKKPVSVLIVNGTEDPLVPYNGGEIRVGRRKLGKVISTDETVRFWVRHNRCEGSPEVARVPDRDRDDGTTVRKEAYAKCASETEVALYAVEGGGHTWPSGWQYLPKWFIGRVSREINGADEIWSFFSTRARA